MQNMNINWNSIRPLNGSQATGFEELCAQLARAESPADSFFIRKGTPDAGVECFCIHPDKSEWGWQAKYFDSLGDSQWSQLNSSVKTVLEKHPNLVRYFICIPLDRPDARIEGRRSTMQRWSEHVDKWTEWATKLGRTIEFIWWGNSELLERLSHTEHTGRLYFWFGKKGFDTSWFQARLTEALATAGPRYTPEAHVELPIGRDLSLFGRTDDSIDCVKALAQEIRKELSHFQYLKESDDGSYQPVSKDVTLRVGKAVLQAFAEIENLSAGEILFKPVIEKIELAITSISDSEDQLNSKAQEYNKPDQPEHRKHSRNNNPYWNEYGYLFKLRRGLQTALEQVVHADSISNNSLLILNGAAGTGKTHLLCDFAQTQINSGSPTVLLMGQRFITSDSPWVQILQQTDLSEVSADEFIGALEAAAQASKKRALLIIDAINEGQGRKIWPANLNAFLTTVQSSPWIGVLLSVRSTYEDVILPEDVQEKGFRLTHRGFHGNEYNATKTFFSYYGLEWTSTPIIQPEFSNPLFLKTVCRGLRDDGYQRLPRGFYGLSAAFDLYLSTVNKRLSTNLDFNPQDNLVLQALEKVICNWDNPTDRRILRNDAEKVVNELLPNREYGRSLYRGMVDEGVLIEEMFINKNARKEAVYISYERFADHLLTRHLLETFFDAKNAEKSFEDGAGLAFIRDGKQYIAPGLMEAFCIQLSEQTGKELPDIVPELLNRWGIGEVFRQSIIWRDPKAVSQKTRDIFNKLIKTDHDKHDTIDMLLTVATIEEHPLNAEHLNHRLREDLMPDRDSWWSTYLHRAWGSEGPVDRLVDWAKRVTPNDKLPDSLVELCATTLAWFFSTPNRYLRDHATKALVSLLSGRLSATERLITKFADVDDPYVLERVYAVAYGVTMRSSDVDSIGVLATKVYSLVFADNQPVAHILLRDYARGVIERALYLGADIDIDEQLVRPHYNSTWPDIPSEEDVKQYKADRKKGAFDSGELEWGKNRIYYSVMGDDFARYVIGTNSSTESREWLSLRHDDEPWLSSDEQIEMLLSAADPISRQRWDEYKRTEEEYRIAATGDRIQVIQNFGDETEIKKSKAHANAERALNEALKSFAATLPDTQLPVINQALDQRSIWGNEGPPRFDLKKIQRYILRRVFDLGWTVNRFGQFDRYEAHSHGRDAAKAERMGKKYQWIAYHEILAFLSDHYRYEKQNEGCDTYQGPWQDFFRDIDPSCTVVEKRGGTSWDGHNASWWGSTPYEKWGNGVSHQEWITSEEDLPYIEPFLKSENPANKTRWVNLNGYFLWQQPFPADVDSSSEDRREIFYMQTGYFVKKDDISTLMLWAEGVDFWGRWMPDPADSSQMFLGEYGWSPVYKFFDSPYYGGSHWKTPDHNCPASVRVASEEFLSKSSGFDCSVKDSYTLQVPIFDLIEKTGLQWSGVDANFVDGNGELACFDPTVQEDGPSSILVREDLLQEYLSEQGLVLFWILIGEKRVLSQNHSEFHGAQRITGAFMYDGGNLTGFKNHLIEEARIRS